MQCDKDTSLLGDVRQVLRGLGHELAFPASIAEGLEHLIRIRQDLKTTFGRIGKTRRRFAIKETQSEKSSQERNVVDHAAGSYDSWNAFNPEPLLIYEVVRIRG